ncbi:hypothetical protein SAMN06298216_3869 [Spirosomataceae bacterium TFI 002]|nr:hypothetical protein SAMN06298216_3869 [Spirosomataceae bacterium TFI 002]
MKNVLIYSALFTLLVFTNSCKDNQNTVSPILSTEVENALKATLEDEYKAQVTYQRILNDFGKDTRPFVNIKSAEVKHANSISNLMNNYNLVVPSNEFDVNEMPTFNTVKEACALGVIAEIANIELYDSYLSLDMPADVRIVFENNRSASLNNHLPAFENCSK